MKENLTELVFILDKSGSMEGHEQDVIGGFNSMLKKQKEVVGEANVTTVLFSDNQDILYYRRSLINVKEMTSGDYIVGGCTALLDVFGSMINGIGEALLYIPEYDRPSKVLFVIMTDGHENSSRYFKQMQIKKMVETQKAKYAWEFLFLGADLDTMEVATSYGIPGGNSCVMSLERVEDNFMMVDNAVTSLRNNKEIDADWSKKVENAN